MSKHVVAGSSPVTSSSAEYVPPSKGALVLIVHFCGIAYSACAHGSTSIMQRIHNDKAA